MDTNCSPALAGDAAPHGRGEFGTFQRRVSHILAFLCLGLSWISPSLARAQSYTEIRELGTGNRFCGFYIDDVRELEIFLSQYRGDVDLVLRTAGFDTDGMELLSVIAEGRVREVRVPVGTELEWMAVRKNRRPTLVERVRWAGSEPFDAFEIALEANGSEHRLLIPKNCGNLSLLSSEVAPPVTAPSLGVTQTSRCAGAQVTAELAVSERGTTEVELTVSEPDGSVRRLALDPNGERLRWSSVLMEPGQYTFRATVRNARGQTEPVMQTITLEACVPTCVLQLMPAVPGDLRPGRSSLLIDLSSSEAEAGAITSASIDVYQEGEIIDRLSMSGALLQTEWVVPDYGSYRFVGSVQDERGVRSSNCAAAFALQEPVRAAVRPLVSVFGGLERRWRDVDGVSGDAIEDQSAALVGGTIGALFHLDENVAVFGQFGGAANLEETESSSLFVDVGVDVFTETAFFGGGIGLWDLNHETTRDLTLLVHGGVDIGSVGPLTLEWFVEGRLFADKLAMIDNNYVGFTGIRLR